MANALMWLSYPKIKLAGALARLFPADEAVKRMARWRHGKLRRVDLAVLVDKDLVTALRVVHPFDRTPESSLDLYELICINAITTQLQPHLAFEIGTFDGNTALNIAANAPIGCKVYTLDLPVEWNGFLAITVPKQYMNVTDRSCIGRQIRGSGFEHCIEQMYGDSAAFDWQRLPAKPDLIFLDGNHFYEYVKNDTFNALKNIAEGGCIIWHDYGYLRDVSRAVDDIAPNLNIVALQGTRLAVAMF